MGALVALALVTGAPQLPAPEWFGGRIYTAPALHIGIRPAIYIDNEDDGAIEWGAGLTVQATAQVL